MSRQMLPTSSLTERMVAPHPGDRFGDPFAVDYTFGFVDISGFTAYCDQQGEHAAIELLTRFRLITRSIAVRRGVRVAKWLGDGVMLVAADQGPLVATVGELIARCAATGLHTHAGLARGPVLLFEGDDYVGRPVNLAARLCEAADQGEILSCGLAGLLPDWVQAEPEVPLALAGLGVLDGVVALVVSAEVAERFTIEALAVRLDAAAPSGPAIASRRPTRATS
jgi:adenylate cyclase